MSRSKVMAIICPPRVGSSYMVQFLNTFAEIVCAGEIFDEKIGITRNAKFRERVGVCEQIDPLLDPMATIRENASFCGNGIFCFKMMSYHLSKESRREIIKSLDGAIFLDRYVVDAFISMEKALNSGIWAECDGDTSNLKIHFDEKNWWAYIRRFRSEMRDCFELAKKSGIPIIKIKYESFFNKNFEEKVKDFSEKFQDSFGVTLSGAIESPLPLKQDKHDCYRKKIKNYNKFMEFVNKRSINGGIWS